MVDQLLRDFVDFMDHGLPSLPILLAASLCISPVLALVHELGHALAALLLLPGRVVVVVGGPRPLVALGAGRLTVALHPLVIPWRFDAVCAYDPGAERRADIVLIALAGPAASLVTGVFLWGLLGSTPPGVAHDVLAVATFMAIGSVVLCLLPLTLTDSRGTTLRTDGGNVLAALR